MAFRVSSLVAVCLCSSTVLCLGISPEQVANLPQPAQHTVDFTREVKPIFESSCIKCHGRGRAKGGFQLDTRETLLRGGDSGPALVLGKSAESLLVALVSGIDPENVMPKKGSRLTPDQVGILRAWIDQGAVWEKGVSFGRLEPANLKPRLPQIPTGTASENPADRLLEKYFVEHKIRPEPPVNDRLFARRAYLDLIGLLPQPDELRRFLADKKPDKRSRLVRMLLARDRDYAAHWLSFWNDMLRNDYKGTGYIDGGREQITGWLYSALLTNMPYNLFVAQLIDPVPASAGFTKGIVWRGVVNASQTPQMQAAQNICQVFMGVNLKCASCHDSFVNDLTLADAYGLAGIYADGPLEMVQCDKPLGRTADVRFIYPELGAMDPAADKSARLHRLAEIICQRQDGRLTRTLVNRVWQRLFGRGLVEPVDDMEKQAWDYDLLDWLAEDFANHNYDVKHLLAQIVNSRAYQLPAIDLGEATTRDFVFRGPGVRRVSAEQFRDALTSITGAGYSSPAAEVTPSESEQKRFKPPVVLNWIWNDAKAGEQAPPGHVYFRKKIVLSFLPDDATAFVMCDNSFTLFVNGNRIGSGSDFKNAFLFDLRTALHEGENVFAIDAVNHLADGSPPPEIDLPKGQENPAGLLFYARLRVTRKGAATNDLVSDSTWKFSNEKQTDWEKSDYNDSGWDTAVRLGEMGMAPWRVSQQFLVTKFAMHYPGTTRASLVAADSLLTALGRPNREQVVTSRSTAATTLQALELTNGETLTDVLKQGAENILKGSETKTSSLTELIYERALSRKPTRKEAQLAREIVGESANIAGIEDLLWAVVMLPEFQLIY